MDNTCVGRGLVGAVTVGSPTNTLSNKKYMYLPGAPMAGGLSARAPSAPWLIRHCFRRHDISNSRVTVGAGENAVCVSKL